MSAQEPQATADYSKTGRGRTEDPRASGRLGTAAAGLGIAGAILAVVATFSTVIKIQVLTVTPARFTGYDRYGPALILLAVFGVLMIVGAVRGSRAAMAAVALTGLAILLISVLLDLPHLHDKGVWPQADQYEDAQASAGTGYYFETASGVLMLLSGVLTLMLAPRRRADRPAPAERAARPPAERAARPPAERAARPPAVPAPAQPVPPPPAPARAPAPPPPAPVSVQPAREPPPQPAPVSVQPAREPPPPPSRAPDEWFAVTPPEAELPTIRLPPTAPRRRRGGLIGRLRRRAG